MYTVKRMVLINKTFNAAYTNQMSFDSYLKEQNKSLKRKKNSFEKMETFFQYIRNGQIIFDLDL